MEPELFPARKVMLRPLLLMFATLPVPYVYCTILRQVLRLFVLSQIYYSLNFAKQKKTKETENSGVICVTSEPRKFFFIRSRLLSAAPQQVYFVYLFLFCGVLPRYSYKDKMEFVRMKLYSTGTGIKFSVSCYKNHYWYISEQFKKSKCTKLVRNLH
jgi:hypothetical protein